MLLLAVDLETTGLSVTDDRIIEVGAALWDTERKTTLVLFSQLVKPGVPVPDEITSITGIRQDDLDAYGRDPAVVLAEFQTLLPCVGALVAHNALNFDKPFLENEMRRNGLSPSLLPWLDTSVDVPYPETIRTRKLTHLAAEHGFLNMGAHRALTDVLTMLRVLSFYPIDDVVRNACEPKVTLVAQTKKPWEDAAPDGKKETDKAKARGFRWDGGKKSWTKTVRESQVAAECEHGEFPVRVDRGS